jgi:hypothetical protein
MFLQPRYGRIRRKNCASDARGSVSRNEPLLFVTEWTTGFQSGGKVSCGVDCSDHPTAAVGHESDKRIDECARHGVVTQHRVAGWLLT